jgi:HlyD family secretion protein
MGRMKKTTWMVGAAVLALAAGGGWWWVQRAGADAVQYRTAKIERGPLSATVSASGTVNPVTQVSVGTQVSGQVKDIYVDFNSEVKAGQLIAIIDPESIEYRVRQASADADAARAAVLTAQANAAASRAGVSRAQSDLTEAQRSHERNGSLQAQGFISQAEVDRTRALVATAGENLKSAQAQLGVSEAQIKSAQAGVAQREASLAQARIDLSRTRITSPVNGIVIKRTIEKGQTVAASLQAPELFVIAQNLQDMQVDASIDESDVGRIRTGQKATFTVDAFPGQTFEGAVKQVRKAAQNVANVVTYVAVVGFSNSGGRLLPGMTANVRLVTDQRESVLKVPNAALRVRLAGVEPPAGAASGPGRPASGTTTSGWSWLPEAVAQPAGGGGGGGGGGFAAMRERLVTELKLSADQAAKLDTIAADMRPQFMALRDLPEGERAAARDKVQADMRSKINAMLDAGQKAKYAQMQAESQARRGGDGPQPAPAAAQARPAVPGAAPAQAAAAPAARPAPAAPAPTPAPAPAVAADASSAVAAPTGPVAPPISGQGPLVETRNRLVAELKMDAAQAAKLDAIYDAARPRFMALRELPAEERGKARERISADTRASISNILSPEQKQRYAAMAAEGAGRQATRGRIYLLGADGKPKAFNVRLGISDGTMTELLLGPNAPDAAELKEDAVVIIGTVGGAPAAGAQRPAGPRMPF